MKIRSGFVSNSSSSSFVVLLPENFLETIDYEKIAQGDDEFPLSEFTRMLLDFTQNKEIRDISIYNDYEYEKDDDYCDFYHILYNLIKPYIIASIDTGPDDSDHIIIANRDTIKKLI